MYAYSQTGVVNASIEVDEQAMSSSVPTTITYKIKLSPYYELRFKKYKEAQKEQSTIMGKVKMLFWTWMGAPVGLDENIIAMAKSYLPASYRIEVVVV